MSARSVFLKLLDIFGNKANGPAVLDANGDLVAPIVPRTGTLAALQLLAGSPGEVASATDVAAIVKYTGVAGEAQTFYQPPYALRNAVIPTIPGFIGANTTVTIGSGKNFADMTAFKTFIEQCVVDESATITLKFDKGVHIWQAPSTGRTWPHLVLVSDQTAGTEVITGVASSSAGAAGAWTHTLSKTGLADSILGAGAATGAHSIPVAIVNGTAGTNPDNAVGVYAGLSKTDANTITLSGFSALTAMPTVSATCTINAPQATLVGFSAAGNYRSITFGSSAFAPVSVDNIGVNIVGQKLKTEGGINVGLISVQEISCKQGDLLASNLYTQLFAPYQCRFKQAFALITDSFGVSGCDVVLAGGSFFIDQGLGTTSYGCDTGFVSFTGIILNTLTDGQLEPVNSGVMQIINGTTINGTTVTGANLANYTTLTPGTLSAQAGFIYFT